MKRALLVLVSAIGLATAAIVFFPDTLDSWFEALGERIGVGEDVPPAPMPDPEAYEAMKSSLADWRARLAAQHAAARNEAARRVVLDDARVVLESSLPGMMRCWLGTPWAFEGTAATPGDGRIACGYFVSTVLRDAGFRVHRYHLAQQPSGNILRTFLPRASCKLNVGEDYEAFANALESGEPGIYIVGLDTHVGFIVVRDGELRFIHSSGSRPWAVVDESRVDAHVLRKSNWRMLGHLTADREVLRKWLAGADFPVHGRAGR